MTFMMRRLDGSRGSMFVTVSAMEGRLLHVLIQTQSLGKNARSRVLRWATQAEAAMKAATFLCHGPTCFAVESQRTHALAVGSFTLFCVTLTCSS